MRQNTLRIGTAAAAAALAITGCSGGGSHEGHSEEGGSHEEHSASSSPSYEDVNQADVDYARGMIMHHEQAVEMSDIVLKKSGVDPEVSTMATKIKKAQKAEVKEMQSWLEDWGEDTSDHGGHGESGGGGMDHEGMVSPEDVAELKKADGKRASQLFLDQMIEHHQGAVTMAEDHRREGENSTAVDLSATVIKDQKAEIKEMREMRASL